jgi:hypothetical protein
LRVVEHLIFKIQFSDINNNIAWHIHYQSTSFYFLGKL